MNVIKGALDSTSERELHRHGGRLFLRPVRDPGPARRPEEPRREAAGDIVITTRSSTARWSLRIPERPGGLARPNLPRFRHDASLKAWLQTDHIDLYQIRSTDPGPRRSRRLLRLALDDLVRMGKVRYIGVLNPGRLAHRQVVLGVSERHGAVRATRKPSRPITPSPGADLEREDRAALIAEEKLGLMVWSPLAGGLLSGTSSAYGASLDAENARRVGFDFPPSCTLGDRAWACVASHARDRQIQRGVSVAAGWRLAFGAVAPVRDERRHHLAARTLEQLNDNLYAPPAWTYDPGRRRTGHARRGERPAGRVPGAG